MLTAESLDSLPSRALELMAKELTLLAKELTLLAKESCLLNLLAAAISAGAAELILFRTAFNCKSRLLRPAGS